MRKYKIWDGVSIVKTPSGEVFTPEQWKDRYAILKIDGVHGVLSNSFYDGSLFDTLEQMRDMCIMNGATFPEGLAGDDLLLAIEQFEVYLAEQNRIRAEEEESKRLAEVAAEEAYMQAVLEAQQKLADEAEFNNMMQYA